MIESSVHVHSTFCDGSDTMEQMARAAFDKRLKCIGFSSHSYTAHDDFGMNPKDMPLYITEAKRLKGLYDGRMDVLCGLELDSVSADLPYLSELDYIIGSSHSVSAKGVNYIIDGAVKNFERNVNTVFDGDYLKMCEAYYSQFASFICKTKPDIVGHFDLVTKYNERHHYFDACCKRYKDCALTAMDSILETGAVIEVNTGAITRGHRSVPYPADFILERISEKKGKVIITTDAHSASAITGYASDAEALLKSIGFVSVVELGGKGFYERRL